MAMSYSKNPHLSRVRAEAVKMLQTRSKIETSSCLLKTSALR